MSGGAPAPIATPTDVPADLPTVALAQMEVRAGRPGSQRPTRMLDSSSGRAEAGAAIVAFPEMCIPGYILGDTWEIDALVEDYESWSDARSATRAAALRSCSATSRSIAKPSARTAGCGNSTRRGSATTDASWSVPDGLPAPLPHGVHPKTLHPNYRFFDDDRHFYSLRKIAAETDYPIGRRLDGPVRGPAPAAASFVSGCSSAKTSGTRIIAIATSRSTPCGPGIGAGADLVVNLSASPWTWQKNDKRNRVVREAMARSPVPFFYVNKVGAQNNGKNILVFDGDTCGYRTGRLHRGPCAALARDAAGAPTGPGPRPATGGRRRPTRAGRGPASARENRTAPTPPRRRSRRSTMQS